MVIRGDKNPPVIVLRPGIFGPTTEKIALHNLDYSCSYSIASENLHERGRMDRMMSKTLVIGLPELSRLTYPEEINSAREKVFLAEVINAGMTKTETKTMENGFR